MGSGLRQVNDKRNPYYSNRVGGVGFTIGTEAADAITVAVQLRTNTGADIAARGHVRAWLSGDATGDSVLNSYLMPTGGVAAGADGHLIPGPAPLEGLYAKGTLAIDVVPEKFKTTSTAYFRIGGVQYTKAAATAIVFSAAHVVNATKFGVVLIQVNAAGTVSTKVPLTPQAYNSAALALAALPAPDAGNVPLGYIAIAAKAATWTANTDDLTNGSDLTTATFVDAGENGKYPAVFDLVSEADGDIDVVLTHVGVRTFYLAVQLPNGAISVSSAITFA